MAIDLLKKRFGRPKQIMAAHMDKLIKNSCLHSGQYMMHIRGLAALKVTSEQYGSLLMPMIISKLPSDIRLRVTSELNNRKLMN